MNQILASTVLASTALLCAAAAEARIGQGWQQIAREVSPHAYSVLDITPTIRGEASMDRQRRKVSILWRYDVEMEFGSQIECAVVQEVATHFVPTQVEFVRPDTLLVAGEHGNRISIEAWKLRPPELFTLESGSPLLVAQALESVDLVFEAEDWQPGYVRSLLGNRGRPGSAFLRFSERHDLYELSWSTPGSTPEVVLGVDQEPLLANEEFNRHSAGDHVELGYVYGLHAAHKADLVTGLRLFDRDRDGVLDAHRAVPWAEAKDMGLFDPTQWIEFAGVAPPR